MKKAMLFFALLFVVVLVTACGNGKSSSNTQQTPAPMTATPKPGPSDADLKKAVDLLKTAQDDIVAAAATQQNNWNVNASWVMKVYFVDEAYEEESFHTDTQTSVYNKRKSARRNVESAKELLGTNGSGDFYNAVKEYYKCVNKFLTLISEFPEGYSKITFTQAIKDYTSDCKDAYEESQFY